MRSRTLSPGPTRSAPPVSLREAIERAGLRRGAIDTLPFVDGDITIGSETELQVAVAGRREEVDLPIAIETSNYFADVLRRAGSGDASRRAVSDLERYLAGNREQIWDNSWVRFDPAHLAPFARQVLEGDLLADKARPRGAQRADAERFFVDSGGTRLLRVPVSYLLKLALADSCAPLARPGRAASGLDRLLACYSNDNSSPEIASFHLATVESGPGASSLACETGMRYLLTQLLVLYAGERFELAERGQQVQVFYAPHPTVAQRRLNRATSDAFYRELFVSPCLSGWQRGEAKRDYMELCHQALSRSQLNAVAKLREAGIITRNLVVLPASSDLSLANNGTHLSLGSRRLGAAAAAGFDASAEKLLGDLAIKIAEHFLPLFVGLYSAAPYRFDFADFHPERVLGFLPHELDFTHLRMLWRRWRGKARNHFLGRSLTPFGPAPLDRFLARTLGLAGDVVPDVRLLDYPVAWMSTGRSPALDGRLGNHERLKGDLHDQGVLDRRMALYLPMRLRAQQEHGFCGFEARHFSVFPSFKHDLARAAELQALALAFAFKAVADGWMTHAQIPDEPFVESERRQPLFAAAAGIPTFYVRSDSPNRFLASVLERTAGLRASRRYPGYLRVPLTEYQRGLLATLVQEAPELIEALGLEPTIADLRRRLDRPMEAGAFGRLSAGVLATAGTSSPWQLDGDTFNTAAESYYRGGLRQAHLAEAWELMHEELAALERRAAAEPRLARQLGQILGLASLDTFLDAVRPVVDGGRVALPRLTSLIRLIVLAELARASTAQQDLTTEATEGPWSDTSSWTAPPARS